MSVPPDIDRWFRMAVVVLGCIGVALVLVGVSLGIAVLDMWGLI